MASPPPPEAAPAEAGLESMEGLVLDTVISRAGARPAAALACASTRLRTAVADDSLWRRFCAEDLGLDAPVDPEGQPLPSFQVRDARPRSSVFFLGLFSPFVPIGANRGASGPSPVVDR